MRAVDEVVVELHHVAELRAYGGKRGFEILERLHRLAPEVSDDLVVAVDPELTGDVDDACRRGDLDVVGIAGGPAHRRWIDETCLAHGSSCSRLSIMRQLPARVQAHDTNGH